MWPNICDYFRNRFVSRSETQCKQEEEVNPFFFLFNKKDKCKNASSYNKSRRKKGGNATSFFTWLNQMDFDIHRNEWF